MRLTRAKRDADESGRLRNIFVMDIRLNVNNSYLGGGARSENNRKKAQETQNNQGSMLPFEKAGILLLCSVQGLRQPPPHMVFENRQMELKGPQS